MCMRMCNMYLSMLLSRNTIFPLTTSRTHATFHEAIYNYKTAGTHYCTCLHLVWNVVVVQIVYTFHSIEKKVMKGRMAQWENCLSSNSLVNLTQ